MNKLFIALFIGVYPVFISAGEVHQLNKEQWAVPKRAETILQMPAIKKTFAELQASSSARLLVRYPGGDEGTLWAHELRSWLVSLGIAGRVIELRPGGVDSSVIELLVQDKQTGTPGKKNISYNKPPM